MDQKTRHRAGVTAFLIFPMTLLAAPPKPFPIANTGNEFPVRFESYGQFSGVGTDNFKFKITDRAGLARAMGAGLYPNNGQSLESDPTFQKWKKKKHLANANPWDFVSTGDPQSEFYVWARTSNVGPGTKLFFMAQALNEAGHYTQAIKAYYAILVNFPKEPCWSADKTFVWYLGTEALSRIETITKLHPEIGYRLKGAVLRLKNGEDIDLHNDVFTINPGQWVSSSKVESRDISSLKVIQERGHGKVKLVQFENQHWQLLKNGKPMVVRGVTYHPTAVGKNLDDAEANSWMSADENQTGKADTPFESWVDGNRNNRRDGGEAIKGDFQLIREMGANTIRIYRYSRKLEYNPKEFDKEVLRSMVKNYGIHAIMGDFLGAYTVGSGAEWEEGTDYTDPVQLQRMKDLVHDYVNDHKAEPYVLMWVLGNENLMPSDYGGVNATRTKASQQVEAYLTFVNEIAEMIHQIDPDHPVAVGNLGLNNLEDHAQFAPAVDIYGGNAYKGTQGFGDLFKQVKEIYDRPVLLTEYGCDAFDSRTGKEDEAMQAAYHQGNWTDIQLNVAGGPEEGNAIGGVVFEFLDEWWKSRDGAWDLHDDTNDSAMAFPDGWSSEEWLGLVSQGDGSKSPLLRRPRKAYYLYRDQLWKN